MSFTMQQIREMAAKGKIKGYTEPKVKAALPDEPLQQPTGKIVTKAFSRKSAGLDFIGKNFWYWAAQKGLRLEEEHMFAMPDRKWRFDYAVPDIKIAVEFEGGIHISNATHKHKDRFNRDTEKYNAATAMGWMVIRLTAMNYTTLLPELNRCYEHRNQNSGNNSK